LFDIVKFRLKIFMPESRCSGIGAASDLILSNRRSDN
jgi:hypothetical protein